MTMTLSVPEQPWEISPPHSDDFFVFSAARYKQDILVLLWVCLVLVCWLVLCCGGVFWFVLFGVLLLVFLSGMTSHGLAP